MINTPTHSSLTKSELQEIEETKETHESNTVKEGDMFTLKCGHEGRVVWVSSDGKSFSVQGVRRANYFFISDKNIFRDVHIMFGSTKNV